MLRRLIGYYLAGDALGVVDRARRASATSLILGRRLESFDSLLTGPGLSPTGRTGVGVGRLGDRTRPSTDRAHQGAYGPAPTDVDQVNHLATHNLFTAVVRDVPRRVRPVVDDAGAALRASFQQGSHEPHYALFLAFLRLLEHARDEVNTPHPEAPGLLLPPGAAARRAPGRAEPGPRCWSSSPSTSTPTSWRRAPCSRPARTTGADFTHRHRDLVANKAVVAELRSLYRHRNASAAETLAFADGRIFAAPAADDGRVLAPVRQEDLRRRRRCSRSTCPRPRSASRSPPTTSGWPRGAA